MTDNEKSEIIRLRMSGMGYKAIAARMKLSRDSVRAFCRNCGINGNVQAAILNHGIDIEYGNVCIRCGARLTRTQRGRNKKFCSDKCRCAYRLKNKTAKTPAMNETVCAGCGRKFINYGKRRYCSHDCYIKTRFGKDDAE